MLYYGGLWSKSFSPSASSDWHQHEKGIFIGCTLSIILFLSGINVVIEYVCSGEEFTTPPLKAFMDDISLLSESPTELQRLLDKCVKVLDWAGMSFRASKSRCLVIKDGKCVNELLQVCNPKTLSIESIPSISTTPIKFLGRVIAASLSDVDQVACFSKAVCVSLTAIDQCHLKGIQKVCILHHLLIPRARWPLLIYEFPVTSVRKIEQKISSYIRKWLRLHRTITNLALYSSVSPCPLPLKSLSSVLKAAKISGHLLLRDSSDPIVANNCPNLRSGNWSVEDTVNVVESEMTFREIMGSHQKGRSGLGVAKPPVVPPKGTQEYRRFISALAADIDMEKDLAIASQLHLQGNWIRWCDYVKMDLSWKSLLAMPSPLISFCIQSTFNTLPCPSNLLRWKLSDDSRCTLCSTPSATIPHILSGCKVALGEGRYTYRHDFVLSEIVNSIESFLSSYTPVSLSDDSIEFVKAGSKIPTK